MRADPRNSLPAFGYYIQDLHAAVAYGLIVLILAADETSAITGCGDQLHAGPFRAARICPASQVAIPFQAGAGLHWRKLATPGVSHGCTRSVSMKGLTMTSRDSSADRAADDGAVRAVLDGLYAAWAVGDAEAFIAPYASDATVVLPGSYLAGRDEIRAAMTDAFAEPLNGSRAATRCRA